MRDKQIKVIKAAREQVRDANDSPDRKPGDGVKAQARYQAALRNSTEEEWRAGHEIPLND
jgi:hypothetical protein